MKAHEYSLVEAYPDHSIHVICGECGREVVRKGNGMLVSILNAGDPFMPHKFNAPFGPDAPDDVYASVE